MKSADRCDAGRIGYDRLASGRITARGCWFVTVAAFLTVGCSHTRSGGDRIAVLPDTVGLRDGDLLFRLGLGPESSLVTTASGGVYSHVGIAMQVGGRWLVIHAVPGENEDRSVPDTLKCEPLTDFFRVDRAVAGAVVRIACGDSVAYAAAVYALGKVRARVLFDHHYRMTDTTELYCTELVYQAYMHQGIDLTGHRDRTGPFLKNGEWYIFPSDLQNSSRVDYLREFSVFSVDGKCHQ